MNGVNRLGRGLFGSMMCLALVAGPVAPAFAQGKAPAAAPKDAKPSKATREKAREAYKKGEEKFAAGDFVAAADAYKTANELIPAAQAQYKMALSLDKAGKAEALDAYKAFLAMPPPEAMAEQKAAADKRLSEMGKATLKITTTPPGASIKIDGERQLDAAPATVAVKPGAHKVEASLADHEAASKDVTVPAGGTVEVALTLKDAPAAPPPPPPPVAAAEPPPAPAPPPAPPPEPKSKVPAYVTLGIGGVGAIVGTIFGLSALSAKSDFKTTPTTDNADKAERNALIADMSFGVALTLGITGTVLLLSADKPAEPAKTGSLRFAPLLSRDTQGAAAQIRF